MSLVFQYGSNTSVKRLNSADRFNGGAKVIEPAYTKDRYELDFTVWSETNKCAAADIVPNGNTNIWGVLYEIPDKLIYRHLSGTRKCLDVIEGEGSNYRRIEIEVILAKNIHNTVRVLTYVAQERKENILTSAEYSTEIINGLKSHAIPKEYLEYVSNRILSNNSELAGKLPKIE